MEKNCLFNLSNQNILLIGATHYLGNSILEVLLKYDAKVFINGRNEYLFINHL